MANQRHPAAVTCRRILEEAEHLIHLRGYRATSLDEIAARCRMTKANLLHHFRSKEELGLAVLDYKIGCYRKNCLDPIFKDGRDPVEAVQELFERAASFHRGNGCKAGCFIGNIAAEMADVSAAFRERAGGFFQEWVSRLEILLERGKAQGAFRPLLDAHGAAEGILSLYEGAMLLARTQRDPGVFDRVGAAARRLLETHRIPPCSRTDSSSKRSMPHTAAERR